MKAGAIHGCVLCHKNTPLLYMEDVGRPNAIDKIAGYMFLNKIKPNDKIFYTTGRLTSEMIIKSVNMRIPIVISRSGFTASGVELARRAELTLIGRAKGKRFTVLSGEKESDRIKIGGIILSGGKSRRMKSDKSLKKINNRSLLEIVTEKSMEQLDYIFINSNKLEKYNFKGTKIDVVKDCIKGYLGPLAGILTGMKWLKKKIIILHI